MTRQTATTFGLMAIILWSIFAVLVVGAADIPTMLLTTLTFGIAGTASLGWTALRGRMRVLRQVPAPVYAIGIASIFGYHILYFSALRLAPPAETMLVGYIWPLLIVLGSALLPGERLRPAHVAGGCLAFSGAALVVLRGGGSFETAALPGYLLALAAACVWAAYSLISRRMGAVPSDVVGVFFLGTALLSLPLHLLREQAVWPGSAGAWAALVFLGLGPVGFAYYAWDVGMKRGNIQLLGVASYATPLLSVLALIVAGVTKPGPTILAAAVLITVGAAIAARWSRS